MTLHSLSSLSRRRLVALASACALSCAWTVASAAAAFDFSPEQKGRVRAEKDAAAIQAIPKNFKFVKEGVFTVAIAPFAPPIATYASDAKTVVGFDPDYAQLVADALAQAAQHQVTHRVAELVVDALEVIDIEHDDRQCLAIALGPFQLELEPLLEVTAIMDAGQ